MPTDVSGLIHFKNTLRRKQQKLQDGEIAKELAEYGESVARQYWAGHNVEIYSEEISPTEYRVVAKGDKVAYIEFGTGAYADGTYAGIVPDKWQYYYDSPYKRTSKSGELGWFTTQITGTAMFTTGRQANNAMWLTAEEMRRKVAELGIAVMR